jgi:membrane protease YdiL (CAAX protease family)
LQGITCFVHLQTSEKASLLFLLYNSGMTNSQAALLPSDSIDTQTNVNAGEKRQRWLELCLVLLVAFAGSILRSVYLLKGGPSLEPPIPSLRWVAGLVQEATALFLLGYVLSRRSLKFANLGLRWSARDVGMGMLVTAVSYAAYAFGHTLIQTIHYLGYGGWAAGPTAKDFFLHPSVAAIPFFMLNPFFEELIVRAYLMTEVIELTGSPALAVALSVGLQFSYHLYYGWIGASSLSFFFLGLALYYARSRRVLPVIFAHAFLDIYGLIRLW